MAVAHPMPPSALLLPSPSPPGDGGAKRRDPTSWPGPAFVLLGCLAPAWLPLRRGPAVAPSLPRAYASRWALTTARTFSRTWSRYSWVGIQLNMKGASGVWKPSASSSAWMFLGPSGAQP